MLVTRRLIIYILKLIDVPYIHTCIDIYTGIHTRSYIDTYVHTYKLTHSLYIYIPKYKLLFLWMYICILPSNWLSPTKCRQMNWYICWHTQMQPPPTHTDTQANKDVYMYTCIHSHIHTHISTHMHTYLQINTTDMQGHAITITLKYTLILVHIHCIHTF